jgi:hypothetical protein
MPESQPHESDQAPYAELPQELLDQLALPPKGVYMLPGEMEARDKVAAWVTADGTITMPESDT